MVCMYGAVDEDKYGSETFILWSHPILFANTQHEQLVSSQTQPNQNSNLMFHLSPNLMQCKA